MRARACSRAEIILGEHGPYLSRYTVRELESGIRLYLHHFHRSDADDDLHNHPWSRSSTILAGSYTEERLHPDRASARAPTSGDSVDLMPNTFHRVDLLDPAAGVLDALRTSRRVQSWGFIDRENKTFTPWREALTRRGLVPQEAS